MKVDGGTVSWKVECPKMNGTGSVTYTSDSYTGKADMVMQGGQEAHAKYSGKYLGPCDEK